jgi:hypothetical protein
MLRSLVALAASAFVAASATADDKFVRLVNVDTGKVLAVKDDSDEAGARTVLAKLDADNKTQQWEVKKDGKHFSLVNRKSGKVLDVNEESREEGAAIIIWDAKDEGVENQRWSWEGDGKERRLKSKSSEMVLDIDDEGRIIQKKADEKAKKQLWRIEEVK